MEHNSKKSEFTLGLYGVHFRTRNGQTADELLTLLHIVAPDSIFNLSKPEKGATIVETQTSPDKSEGDVFMEVVKGEYLDSTVYLKEKDPKSLIEWVESIDPL